MSEILKKPYELSVWEDRSVSDDGGETYYSKEVKVAIIGTDKMEAPNRVFSPVLTENVNGEVTLTFSLYYKYFDDIVGDFVINPFARYLVNERKVKLKYNDRWYDFVIKECEENSEDMIFSYTATNAFVQELSRNGYNITFNTDLNNNQGTIIELAKKTLEHTDWEVDEVNSDILIQTVSEPIYNCKVVGSFDAKNTDTGSNVTIGTNETIYVFYSYVKNQTKQYVQFIRENDRDNWTIDTNNNSIKGTNYRFMSDTTYTINSTTGVCSKISFNGAEVTVGSINTVHQAYRLVYNQLTTYDPIMEKTVDLYTTSENKDIEIYHYQDVEYTTSDSVVSYVTNGSMGTVYSGGTLSGWSTENQISGTEFPTLELKTEPEIISGASLAKLSEMNKVKAYLKMHLPAYNKWKNTVYNSGITDNRELLGSVAAGTTFVLRFRTATNNNANFRAVVARYTYKTSIIDGVEHTYKVIDPSGIYLDFYDENGTTGVSTEKENGDNLITGGTIVNNNYVIDNVIQVPSSQYVYVVETNNVKQYYYYNFDNKRYETTEMTTAGPYVHYWYRLAVMQKPLSKSTLDDPNDSIGLFFFTSSDNEQTYLVEEVQLFKYVTDKNNKVVFPGSAPEATTNTLDYYYLKPNDNVEKEQVNLYTSTDILAKHLSLKKSKIKPAQNEKGEKILSISEEKSNCFNILQTLCETFECWLKIDVEHDDNGAISLDKYHNPKKRIIFKEYIGKDNFAGFRYGINLQSIQRTIDSNEFVTKLIVNQVSNDYVDNGILDIADARSNPSGASYILNFNYYINQQLIQNPNKFNTDLNKFNFDLSELNKQIKNKTLELNQIETSYVKIKSALTTYTATLEAAQTEYTNAINEFEKVTGVSYETYVNNNSDIDIVDAEAASDIIATIYDNAIKINTYKGLLGPLTEEYYKFERQCKGAQSYIITVSVTDSSTNITLSDFIKNFKCTVIDRNGNTEEFISSVNERAFESNIPYRYLKISAIPPHYKLQILSTGAIIKSTELDSMSLRIYNGTEEGMVTHFKLIPEAGYSKSLLNEIEDLQVRKDALEKEFFTKYSHLIQEGTWDSSDYIDPELYYFDALQVAFTSAQPKVSYQINVSEISEIQGYQNYIFDVGDKTYIEDTDFFGWEIIEGNGAQSRKPIKEIVVVSQVEWHLDEPESNTITVQNYKTQFEDLFQRISAAVQTVQYNQGNFARIAGILDENGQINAKLLAKSLSGVTINNYDLCANGVLEVTNEGIKIRDTINSGHMLYVRSRGIDRSEDGGATWLNLISAKGVNTETLTSGSVNTQQISIIDGNNPSFRWDKAGLSAYGFSENGQFDLRTFVRFDKYGIYGIEKNESYIASSLEDIKNKARFGLTWEGFFIKNKYRNGYVSVSSTDDIQVVSGGIERIKIGLLDQSAVDERYGIRINNDEGKPVFETDDNGNLAITGTIYATAGEFSGYLEAREGYIGGFTISDNELYNGAFGEPGSIYLSPGYVSSRTIGDVAGERVWAIGVDNKFGVTTDGTLYATEAYISGNINAYDGNFRGYVNARGGRFQDEIIVGKLDTKFITINAMGNDPIIASSDYVHNTSAGWMINGQGDAIFNNVSVRGAIKTAVFEYGEIEAVGGAFIFRPSSTIKDAWLVSGADIERDSTLSTNDIIVTVENNLLFQQNEWVKASNVNSESGIGDILNDGGLTHVYRIKNKPANDKYIVLENARQHFDSAIDIIESAEGINLGPAEIIQSSRFDKQLFYYVMESDYVDVGSNSAPIYFDAEIDEETGEITRSNPIQLIENKIYYFNYNFLSYSKRAKRYLLQQVFVNRHEDDEEVPESDFITIETDILYIGNLSILDSTEENTGEHFIIVWVIKDNETPEERQSRAARIYLDRELDTCFLKVYETQTNKSASVEDLIGGSLISFGYYDIAFTEFNIDEFGNPHMLGLYEIINGMPVLTEDESPEPNKKYYREQYQNGRKNYGIGINSSDNYVNLPERAISLFETKIKPDASVKVQYEYKGILGTLPELGDTLVNWNIYHNHMVGTQGIFTNNMYIGDNNQYVAFYTDSDGYKQLRIKANQIIYEITDDEGQGTGEYKDVQDVTDGKDGENAINVYIDSNIGNYIVRTDSTATLTCRVTSGTTDITNDVRTFTWTKKNQDGSIDPNWVPTFASPNGQSILVNTSDILTKAIFVCEVEF